MWYIINNNGKLYVLFRYWKKVVDNYDTRSNIEYLIELLIENQSEMIDFSILL